MDTESPRDLARPRAHAPRRRRVVLTSGAVAVAAALLVLGMALRLARPAALPLAVAPAASTSSPATSTTVPPAQLTPVVPAPTTTTSSVSPTTTTTTTTTTATPAAATATTASDAVLVVFDNDHVTLDGAVPTAEARTYLQTLAAANAKGAATIDNRLTVDPAVALTVPVRVIELQSARFPSGSAEVLPDHGAELDRVANVMVAFPHVTLLVIGHADQVGSDAANLELSQARAIAVVNYLIARGVGTDRLSARGVGETDLLADDLGADALALNRRTEFVFTGILLPPTP